MAGLSCYHIFFLETSNSEFNRARVIALNAKKLNNNNIKKINSWL
jgi:hypothetical protein